MRSFPSTRPRASSTRPPFAPSIRTARCRRSSTPRGRADARRGCSIRAPSCSISAKRPGASSALPPTGRSSCRGCSSSPRGIGPFSGQAVHFQHAAPEKLPYAVNRYRREIERHYRVLDRHLAGRDWIVGGDYSIADMSAWGWLGRAAPRAARRGRSARRLPQPQAPVREGRRPAGGGAGEGGRQGSSVQEGLDEETKRAMFPSNYPEIAM